MSHFYQIVFLSCRSFLSYFVSESHTHTSTFVWSCRTIIIIIIIIIIISASSSFYYKNWSLKYAEFKRCLQCVSYNFLQYRISCNTIQSRVMARSNSSALWPLASRDCGFESRLGHECRSVVSVACCQVEFLVGAHHSSRRVLQSVACLSMLEKPHTDDLRPLGLSNHEKKKYIPHVPLEYIFLENTIEVHYLIPEQSRRVFFKLRYWEVYQCNCLCLLY